MNYVIWQHHTKRIVPESQVRNILFQESAQLQEKSKVFFTIAADAPIEAVIECIESHNLAIVTQEETFKE